VVFVYKQFEIQSNLYKTTTEKNIESGHCVQTGHM